MLNFELFLSPISELFFKEISWPKNGTISQSQIFRTHLPSLENVDMAIVGLKDNGGNDENDGVKQAAMEIRKKLYQLHCGTPPYRIADLGNIRNGIDAEETRGRLREVCTMLIQHQIIPIIIGGSHDFTIGQYQGYKNLQQPVNLLNIDAYLDLLTDEEQPFNRRFLKNLLLQDPSTLQHYIHLGFQSYLCDPDDLSKLHHLNFDTIRLGQVRADIKEMEPYIRSAEAYSFDCAAIRSADAPGSSLAQPFGLTGEEACQLSWYAGMNCNASSIGFYEYNPFDDDDQLKTASTIATMIWYFIEGFYNRRVEGEFESDDFMQYLVRVSGLDEPIKFFRSRQTGKWWVEIIAKDHPTTPFWRVPCSGTDYEQALRGEVPDRWFVTLNRIG
ncbi:formimidoylglutamase [Persicobacter psychrovividus]|uniref:Arginase n=1 Tax=Persicobacter psychrovividus TaxID=387638 RepID=A0ABM7VHK0_9BACT|nr:arginase [Persicobacter psychrovividus]